jgi:hypothetical protein
MRLATTQPEILIEASKQEKVHSFSTGDGEARIVIERMTYSEAQALIMRARELIAPYIHGKKPVAIVHDFSGIRDLVIEGLTHSREEVQDIVDADFIAIEDQREEGEDRMTPNPGYCPTEAAGLFASCWPKTPKRCFSRPTTIIGTR